MIGTSPKSKLGMKLRIQRQRNTGYEIRDKVFSEVELDSLKLDDGLKKLLDYFDTQFEKDDLTETYERYIEFERC